MINIYCIACSVELAIDMMIVLFYSSYVATSVNSACHHPAAIALAIHIAIIII